MSVAMMGSLFFASIFSVNTVKSAVVKDGDEEIKLIVPADEKPQDLVSKSGVKINESDQINVTKESEYEIEIRVERAVPFRVRFDGNEIEILATRYTIYDALSANGILLGENDKLEFIDGDGLTQNPVAEIKRFLKVTLLDGLKELREVVVPAGWSVEDVLNFAGADLNKFDECHPDRNTIVYSGMQIMIDRVSLNEASRIEEVDYKIIMRKSDELFEGEVKEEGGSKGERKVFYYKKFVNGQYEGEIEISSEITQEPVDKVITNGTKSKSSPKPHEYVHLEHLGSGNFKDKDGKIFHAKRSIEGIATAYKQGGTTADGSPAVGGVVAVDTTRIPLGSIVYIEGIGTFRAADTGSALRPGGVLIDICMRSEEDCLRFGKQQVKVYIL
jgi:uncharacterized protein YabE (DUF348 family)/3D (Asp-Asp-Asp) domain-containing protein